MIIPDEEFSEEKFNLIMLLFTIMLSTFLFEIVDFTDHNQQVIIHIQEGQI